MNLANKINAPVTTLVIKPKYLWLLVISFTMATIASNWFDPRQIKLFGLCTGAGSIVFPLTYLIADVITEVYGYKNMRATIYSGFIFYIIFFLYGQFVAQFSSHPPDKIAYSAFLHINNRIVFATTASFIVTEFMNSYLVAKLKIYFQGKYIGIRFIFSTFTAYIFDELIYAPIAFYGLMNLSEFSHHMFESWIFMVTIELLLMPFFVRLAKYLKAIEGTDYDDTVDNPNILTENDLCSERKQ
jgi:uncharacterized integral membrane protein (TIGR00697 family)